MELILWRHADAEPGEPDAARALTAKGKRQARKMGEWLDRHLPDTCRILSSPAVRCIQTAHALGREFIIEPALGIDSELETMIAASGWPGGRGPVLLVGHQPLLGQAAALLMTGQKQDWRVRKAGFIWLAQKPGPAAQIYIRAVLGADLLR